MKIICIVLVVALAVLSISCKSTTKPVEKKSKEVKVTPGDAGAMKRLPPLDNRAHFEDLMRCLKTGNDEERRTILVAIQLRMDLCLPFIIEHLEDAEPFKGIAYPFVTRMGKRISSFSIPDKDFTTGAALEMFLVSYFYKDPARKTFHPKKREGTIEVWKKWYDQRLGLFRWNSWDLYSNK